WNVDQKELHRLLLLPIDLAGYHRRTRDLQLIALTAHGLDNHRKLQLATAQHPPRIGGDLLDTNADIAARLQVEPFPKFARGHIGALAAGPRRVVNREGHRNRGFIDANGRQRDWLVQIRDGFTNRDVLNSGNDDDISSSRLSYLDAFEPTPLVQPRHLAGGFRPVDPTQRVVAATGQAAPNDSADGKAAHIVVIVEVVDLELKARVLFDFRTGKVSHNRVEQRF